MTVRLELAHDGGWLLAGEVGPDERPGSISSDDPAGRQVYLFGWLDGEVGVWWSTAGVDAASPETRVMASLGLSLLSSLAEPYELVIWRAGAPLRVRLRLDGEEAAPLVN